MEMKMIMVVIPPQQRPGDHDDHYDADGDDHGEHKYVYEKDHNSQNSEDLGLVHLHLKIQ